MFDTIARWFSKKTLEGFGTKHYQALPDAVEDRAG
jgi:hypothetical protein